MPIDEASKKKIVPKLARDCGGFPETIEIFCGERVMLKRNISVVAGLVNGSLGSITNIIWPGSRRQQIDDELPAKICIKFDRPVTGVTLEPDGS